MNLMVQRQGMPLDRELKAPQRSSLPLWPSKWNSEESLQTMIFCGCQSQRDLIFSVLMPCKTIKTLSEANQAQLQAEKRYGFWFVGWGFILFNIGRGLLIAILKGDSLAKHFFNVKWGLLWYWKQKLFDPMFHPRPGVASGMFNLYFYFLQDLLISFF